MPPRLIFAVLSASIFLSIQAGLRSGHFAETSQMSAGRWVKVTVDSSGVYQLTHERLRELGFDNPAQVSVRGFSAADLSGNNFTDDLPDDLPPAKFMHTADGRLLFYGEGAVSVRADENGAVTVKRNHHDLRGYYFLSDVPADAADELQSESRYAVDYLEYEAVNRGRGGAIYHDRPLDCEKRVYSFNVSRLTGETAIMHYEFAAKSSKPLEPVISLPDGWVIEKKDVKTADASTVENRLYTTGYGNITISGIKGDGRYDVGFALPEGDESEYAAIDRAWLVYTHDQMTGVAAEYDEPCVVGQCSNQNLHCHTTPEMVIITTRELVEAADELAEIHRSYDGMDVRVVAQEDIFNEFSSGCRSAMAVRLYLKMLMTGSPKTLRHVIMYGRSEWDRRRAVERGALICYETENPDDASDENRNYVSDKYFAMLEDDYDDDRATLGKMSVNIGRIDVNTLDEGRMVNAKIKAYIEKLKHSSVYGTVVTFSDSGDGGQHLTDIENKIALMSGYNRQLLFRRIHSSMYAVTRTHESEGRKALANVLSDGCGFMIYCGHAGMRELGADGLYDASFVKNVKYDDPPFVLISSCETFGFDRNSTEMAQTMLKADRGGAVGVIGASRSVYMELNRSMADAIVERYALAEPGTTIGDVMREAHNYCVMAYTDEARATNAMCYNLCGDPALRIGAPDARINITTENCEGFVKVSGNVAGRMDFSGQGYIRVYDDQKTAMSRDGINVTVDGAFIGEWSVRVRDGHFETGLSLPQREEDEHKYRIYVSAVDDSGTASALGSSEFGAIVVGDPSFFAEPEIESLAVEDIAPHGRESSGRTARISAIIVSEGGLAYGRIGAMPAIRVDGRECFRPKVMAVERGRYEVACEIEGLAEGRHELVLTAQSQSGQKVSATREFVMGQSRVDCWLSSESRIVRDEAVIELSHNFSGDPTARLVVEDSEGRTVFSVSGCEFPFVWKLRDSSGRRVADGRYYVYALLRDSFDRGATDRLELIVVE